MRAILKRPGEQARAVDVVGLEGIQKLVQGYVEAVVCDELFTVYCNDDALALGLRPNVVLGADGDTDADLSDVQAREWAAKLDAACVVARAS